MKKKSKDVTLICVKTKQDNLDKRQFRITLPTYIIDELDWKHGDKLKVWINPKKHVQIRKKK
jgi:hypothetical protein